MAAAAVIIIRIKRVFSFLRDRRAVSPESAVPESEVPYSDRWYFRRVVAYGAVKRADGRCYLDDALAEAYLRRHRRRGLVFAAIAIVVFCVFELIWALI